MARKRKPRVEYQEMPEAVDIVRKLVMSHHADALDEAHIVVVGTPQESTSPDQHTARIRVAKPMEKFLLARSKERADYIIEIVIDLWNGHTPPDQERILDHELCHALGRDEKGRYRIRRRHDVEEFDDILRRHGAWTPQLERFVGIAQQIRLPGTTRPGSIV